MAVGPACHRCGNRASLGPGTIRISDMFQFRFFVHLSFFFFCLLASPLFHSLTLSLPLSLSLSRSFSSRDSRRISLSHSSFPFHSSLSHLVFLSYILSNSITRTNTLPFHTLTPSLSLSFSRSRSRSLFLVSTFLEQLCNRNYNRKCVFTLLSTFSPLFLSLPLSPIPPLFLSFQTFIRILRISLGLLEHASCPLSFLSLGLSAKMKKK